MDNEDEETVQVSKDTLKEILHILDTYEVTGPTSCWDLIEEVTKLLEEDKK